MLKSVSSVTNAIGAVNYKGTWNASTNTPNLAASSPDKGDYYVVSVAGNTNLGGITTWYVGDWAVYNGSVWQRVEGGADDPAPSVRSNSTTGLMEITGPAAGQTRVMTIPDANFTAARTDAGQTFTGDQAVAGNVTLNAQGDLRFADADSSNYVAFQAPGVIAADVTWTLPDVDGTSGQVLATNGTGTLSWAAASGDVVGPASSTDNAVARFDSITGKIIKNSVVIVDDTGAVSGATQLNVDNLRLDGNTISSTDTNGNIVLAPNGTGDVQVDADTLRVGDSGVDANIQSNGNADLILKTGNATTGSVTLADGANGNLTVALNGTGQVIVNAGAVGTPTIAPTGDTNTGIFFPAADTIGFAEGGAQCGEFDSSANFKFNSGYGSVATAYGCRAWVNFNGTGTVAIRASGNVSSISDNGTGRYTVNITTAMPDANYSCVASCSWQGSTSRNIINVASDNNSSEAPTTTAIQLEVANFQGGNYDSDYTMVAIFR